MDLGYRYEKNVLELFEIRQMNFDPSSKEELPVAKAKYIQTSRTWKIYCRDQNQKWKAYHHHLQISNLEDVLIIIDEDNEQCFW